ncbi:TPA: hypothetical protein QH074_004322 [Enterobacter hormaechei subsp. steigerwaltii]|nr:hypothetical protein [Enterobacter hormaechei subsp. steigerwaltii]
MKGFKWVVAAAVAVSLTGCVIPADNNYDNDGYSHKHHDGYHHGHRQAADYESEDGARMITRDGVTLPNCEDVGGSQADNGSTCYFE